MLLLNGVEWTDRRWVVGWNGISRDAEWGVDVTQ